MRIGSDATMDPGFASQLNGTCSSDPNAFAFLDPSPVGFHNAFYHVLYSDIRSCSTVDYYASNQGVVFGDFMAAMTKLGRIGVKTLATGSRTSCYLISPAVLPRRIETNMKQINGVRA